jgi:hypothetical protein
MSTHNGNTLGLLSATTTFGFTTVGVALVPSLSDSFYFRLIALVSYIVIAALLLSFIFRQLAVRKIRKR